ncbi:MAG: hypothetical protein KAW12_06050 [Candidatus Aminicenantes bacterium]|nr:hypothetical protein [Candidatus Aminicenantes bacterium]
MRNIIDMDNKIEIGFIDWEFIHDMQGIAPGMINPQFISLNNEFLNKIPKKWEKIKTKLAKHLKGKELIHAAISDVENLGSEFKIRGTLRDKKSEPLSFHKVVVMDEDKFEDDYIGAVITDKDGGFSLSFGKKTFSDFGLEAEPDIYLKISFWRDGLFHELTRVTPEVRKKSETSGDKIIMEFGVIEV